MKNLRIIVFFLVFSVLILPVYGQTTSSKVEKGSATAKAGFLNETEIAGKFNNWKQDAEATQWLVIMGYSPNDVLNVKASKPHGEKTDVQVVVTTAKGDFKEGISIKLVSNPNGFNQIDKRWLASYAKLWKMPNDVTNGLKFFLGETKPDRKSRNTERMFLNELDKDVSDKVVAFFTENKDSIVSDIFEGDGVYAAKWFMVAYKASEKPRWILRPTSEAVKFFSDGPVEMTRAGNLKIGRITMQRKGGDGGRETAKMLQFKINPALLLDTK